MGRVEKFLSLACILLTLFLFGSFVYSEAPMLSSILSGRTSVFNEYSSDYSRLSGVYDLPVISFDKFGLVRPHEAAVAFLDKRTLYKSPILVNKYFWSKYERLERKWLIIHELAHSTAGADHDNRVLSDGCAAHFMNMYALKIDCILKYESLYEKQVGLIRYNRGKSSDIYVKLGK